eukprot:5226509-Pleurochrysis_carterae.AAC.1
MPDNAMSNKASGNQSTLPRHRRQRDHYPCFKCKGGDLGSSGPVPEQHNCYAGAGHQSSTPGTAS